MEEQGGVARDFVVIALDRQQEMSTKWSSVSILAMPCSTQEKGEGTHRINPTVLDWELKFVNLFEG